MEILALFITISQVFKIVLSLIGIMLLIQVVTSIRKKDFSKLKKVLFKLLILLLLTLILLAPSLLGIFESKDITMPDDQDLHLTTLTIPETDNSYFDLKKLENNNKLDDSTGKTQVIIPEEINISDFLESYQWDKTQIENLLKKNADALIIYNEAVKKPLYQYYPTADPSKIKLNSSIGSVSSYKNIARISCIKSLYLMQQNRNQEAFEEALKTIILGDKIEKSENANLLIYLIGISIKKAGLETMQVLIKNSSASNDLLNNYQNKIITYAPSNNTDQFKSEYLIQKDANSYIKLGLSEGKTISKNKFYFKPNETIKLSADLMRQQIDRFKKACSINSPLVVDEPKLSLNLYYTENAVGKLLTAMGAKTISSIRNKKCDTELLLNSTELLFSIKKYQNKENSLPTNLESLIPNYTDILPIDPYSGNPFLYNLKKAMFYSIGSDYTDNGGKDNLQDSWSSMDDPSFLIN